MSIRRFPWTLAAGILAAAAVLAQTTAPTATATRTLSFPPIGLAGSETAQINVVNLAQNSRSGTAASCSGTISFLDGSGAAIGTPTPFTVASGQIFSANLLYTAIPSGGLRPVFRGVVTLNQARGIPCTLESSLETFDRFTGDTHVFLAQGDLPSYTVGPVQGH